VRYFRSAERIHGRAASFFQNRNCRMLEAQVRRDSFSMEANQYGGADFNFLDDHRQKINSCDPAVLGSGKLGVRKEGNSTTIEVAFAGDPGALSRLHTKLAGPITRFGIEPQKKSIADVENDLFFGWFDQRC